MLEATSNPAIHLYRAILRECTYLPDSLVRARVAKHARNRFEECRDPKPYHLPHHFRSGWKGFGVLSRANAGDTKRLEKVLAFGYGRWGKMKHEMWKPILAFKPEVVPEPIIPGKERSRPPVMSKVLEKVLKVQQLRTFKGLKPVVPETNIWGRPTPKVRIPNIMWRNHTRVMNAARPPLPLHEFKRLEGLAYGNEPLLKRRERPQQRVRDVPEKTDAHQITPRFLRRIYGLILKDTTFWAMTEDGECVSNFSEISRPRLQASEDEMLDGSGNAVTLSRPPGKDAQVPNTARGLRKAENHRSLNMSAA